MRNVWRRVGLACAAALLGAMTPAVGASGAPQPPTRAMWVWDSSDPSSLLADASRRGLADLYVAVSTGVAQPGEKARLATLSLGAQAAGITLWALGGDPSWTTNTKAALTWQKAALATGYFAGAHVDIEPWALPAWSTPSKRPALVKSWAGTLSALQQASPLPLHADVSFWADEIPNAAGGTMADAALGTADLVVVMSYRDSAAGVLDVGSVMLGKAQAAGRPIRLAVETNPLTGCSYCTFAGQSPASLNAALTEIDTGATAVANSYTGVSVHDRVGWTALESSDTPAMSARPAMRRPAWRTVQPPAVAG